MAKNPHRLCARLLRSRGDELCRHRRGEARSDGGSVEHRFALPHAIEWLTDKDSCYTAQDTRRFASDMGLVPGTAPVESPRTTVLRRSFARSNAIMPRQPTPNARAVIEQLPAGSTIIIACIRTVLSATDYPANLSTAQLVKDC